VKVVFHLKLLDLRSSFKYRFHDNIQLLLNVIARFQGGG
jgi:hypothetical protein